MMKEGGRQQAVTLIVASFPRPVSRLLLSMGKGVLARVRDWKEAKNSRHLWAQKAESVDVLPRAARRRERVGGGRGVHGWPTRGLPGL
jgi:hypothetical protein